MNLKYKFNDAWTRKLIIKMADLARQYQEPYDDRDAKAYDNNRPLEQRWIIYAELLNEMMGENE